MPSLDVGVWIESLVHFNRPRLRSSDKQFYPISICWCLMMMITIIDNNNHHHNKLKLWRIWYLRGMGIEHWTCGCCGLRQSFATIKRTWRLMLSKMSSTVAKSTELDAGQRIKLLSPSARQLERLLPEHLESTHTKYCDRTPPSKTECGATTSGWKWRRHCFVIILNPIGGSLFPQMLPHR